MHHVIYGLKITVPLGINRTLPQERAWMVLDIVTRLKTLRYFAVDLSSIELRASDLDWSFDSGLPMVGMTQDLALKLCDRQWPLGRLQQSPIYVTGRE